MKIKVKNAGIAIIEIGDGGDSSELQAIAADLKQSITGLNAIVDELSNIIITELKEQISALAENVKMVGNSVTIIDEKFQNIFQTFTQVNITNYNTQGASNKPG